MMSPPPFYPTNEEITTVTLEEGDGELYPETLFAFQPLKKSDEGHVLKSKTVSFRLFHVDTSVALWTRNETSCYRIGVPTTRN